MKGSDVLDKFNNVLDVAGGSKNIEIGLDRSSMIELAFWIMLAMVIGSSIGTLIGKKI